MKDLYIKRNELLKNSQYLKIVKWDKNIKREQVSGVIKEQDKVYKKYKFYDNIIKQLNKKKEER